MRSLKKLIITNLHQLAILMMGLILIVAAFLQIHMLQNQARENARSTFAQIEQTLKNNTQELEVITAKYRETCLLNAEAIAYMIQYHPEILGDIEELRRIARMMEVDEIHIFDDTGRIFTGSHPEYYNFTFETGEQIGFFAPLLTDKSLRLCQDITPNTAEGKLVQYSALWSADGQFIVQVGMYPETVLEYTRKNELSYIFSLLQGTPGVTLYAIDEVTGQIMGSTNGSSNGKLSSQIGLPLQELPQYKWGTHVTVSGVNCYCVMAEMNDMLLGYTISSDQLYANVAPYNLILAGCLALIVALIVAFMWMFTKRYIVASIHSINEKLSAVAEGNLDERVNVNSSLEFAELSSHINHMIKSLLATTDKMGFVLDHTNMRIGVYEYNTKMKTARFTEHVPEILGWSSHLSTQLASDYHLLQKQIEQLQQSPVAGEKNTFRLSGSREVYIRFDKITTGTDTLGILMDVTEEILTRKRIEQERDLDLLTGLYNRRGLEQQLTTVFSGDPGLGALVMIDSDALKHVNDVYGHAIGDLYLLVIADAIRSFGSAKCLSGRQGGDEFVMLLYGYGNEGDILRDLDQFRQIQKNAMLYLEDGSRVPVGFSFGYVMIEGRKDYQLMLAEADHHMYNVKRLRKMSAQLGEEA